MFTFSFFSRIRADPLARSLFIFNSNIAFWFWRSFVILLSDQLRAKSRMRKRIERVDVESRASVNEKRFVLFLVVVYLAECRLVSHSTTNAHEKCKSYSFNCCIVSEYVGHRSERKSSKILNIRYKQSETANTTSHSLEIRIRFPSCEACAVMSRQHAHTPTWPAHKINIG